MEVDDSILKIGTESARDKNKSERSNNCLNTRLHDSIVIF